MNWIDLQTCTCYFKEHELTEIMKCLPDDNTPLRRYLQEAGKNRFGW